MHLIGFCISLFNEFDFCLDCCFGMYVVCWCACCFWLLILGLLLLARLCWVLLLNVIAFVWCDLLCCWIDCVCLGVVLVLKRSWFLLDCCWLVCAWCWLGASVFAFGGCVACGW